MKNDYRPCEVKCDAWSWAAKNKVIYDRDGIFFYPIQFRNAMGIKRANQSWMDGRPRVFH